MTEQDFVDTVTTLLVVMTHGNVEYEKKTYSGYDHYEGEWRLIRNVNPINRQIIHIRQKSYTNDDVIHQIELAKRFWF